MSQYVAVVKRGYVAVSASDEEVQPGNIAALEKGLEARKAERAQDFVRARELWGEAQALLSEESENDGGGAQAQVQVDDTFFLESISNDGWPWTPGYGG